MKTTYDVASCLKAIMIIENATIKELAYKLKVSVTTIHRVFNNKWSSKVAFNARKYLNDTKGHDIALHHTIVEKLEELLSNKK